MYTQVHSSSGIVRELRNAPRQMLVIGFQGQRRVGAVGMLN